jgi:hypothetical protein
LMGVAGPVTTGNELPLLVRAYRGRAFGNHRL